MPAFFIFNGDRLWVRRRPDGSAAAAETPPDGAPWQEVALGPAGGEALAVDAPAAAAPPEGIEAIPLRAFFDLAPPGDYALAARTFELLHWRRTHRFCGRCGRPLARHATERAMACEPCGDLVYPRINPVVIVRVTRGRDILLARRAGGATPFYSVLAGFVEAGETLEQTAEREILEEVGVRVTNLRYFGSQPWPHPNNLMIAFTADYAGGDIRPDTREIAEAGWYDPGHLPPIPPPVSISRWMIEDWRAGQGR
jgi:NAD+ diphosphatase